MVVDLTEDKRNCYFEAGYALGKGKDVIFQRLKAPKYEVRFEFDVKDYPHILYTTVEDLRMQLGKRLDAALSTVGPST